MTKFMLLLLVIPFLSCSKTNFQMESESQKTSTKRKASGLRADEVRSIKKDIESIKTFSWQEKDDGEGVKKTTLPRMGESIYNEEGNLIKRTLYSSGMELKILTKDFHYENGVPVKVLGTDYEGKEYLIEEYIYKENKIKSCQNSRVGPVFYCYEIDFDDKGRKKYEFIDDLAAYGNVTEKIHYYYDKNGLIEKKKLARTFNNKESNYEITFKFDSHNNFIERIKTNMETPDEKIIEKFSYKYDAKGNWIEKISYLHDSTIVIEEREISYR